MAKEAKAEAASGGITSEDLRRIIKDASRQKALASEYSGHHGKVISNAVERYGLEKTALTFVRRMHDMEDGKRQSVLRAVISYAALMGYFDQIDAFDDLLPVLENILGTAKAGAAAKPAAKAAATKAAAKPAGSDEAVASMLQ